MADYPKWHEVAAHMPLALVQHEIDAIRARLDAAGIPQIVVCDPTDQTEVAKECEPFVYTEGWDKGFAQDGDPYGIQSEYLPQSANPDASLPSQAEADAIVAQHNAEREAAVETQNE